MLEHELLWVALACPLAISEVAVLGSDGELIEVEAVAIDSTLKRDDFIAVVAARTRVEGIIALRPAAMTRVSPITIVLRGPAGTRPLMASIDEWKEGVVYVGVTKEQLAEQERLKKEQEAEREQRKREHEAWEREQAERELERENEGKKTLSLLGIYGVTWLDDATPDTEELDPTSINGLGARFTYGLTRRLSLDIETMGASTGTATFAAGSRSATLGRVQGGVMARFGSGRWRPLDRGLVGFQGASYDGVGYSWLCPPIGSIYRPIGRRSQ